MTRDILARLAISLRYASQVTPPPAPGAEYAEWRAYAQAVLAEAEARGLVVSRRTE